MSCRSVSAAYLRLLEGVLASDVALVQSIEVLSPWVGDELNEDHGVRAAFDAYAFPDGRNGAWWIEDRMHALFHEKGEYAARLERSGYGYVMEALGGMKAGTHPSWNRNRLVLSLFTKDDFHRSRAPTPPCMVNLAFYPVGDTLSLVACFRAQYVDAKAYGNLVSLAVLLKKVCASTGFKPGSLGNVALKAILKYPRSTAVQLRLVLLKASNNGKAGA